MAPPRKTRLKKPRFWLAKVIFGLGCLALFAYSAAEYQAFEATAVQTTAKVLSIRKESHSTGRKGGRVTIERPEVRFTVPGTTREITATAKVMSSRDFAAGEEIPVEFDPQRPEDTVRVASGLALLDIAFGFVGLVVLGFGAAERWRWRQFSRATAPSMARGTPAGDSV